MGASHSLWSSLIDFLSNLFKPPTPQPPISGELKTLEPRVLMVIYNPVVDPATGKKLVETMDWNDPDQLAAGYCADIEECSGGLVKYKIVDRVEVDGWPIKEDGFQYNTSDYVAAYRAQYGFHQPDTVDYGAIMAQFNLIQRVAAEEIDEVWLFGGPYTGWAEAAMAGNGAFFCNGGPIPNTSQCPRRFVLMGFNFERGIGEMLEDLGHRAETTLARVFGSEVFWSWAYDRNREPKTVGDRKLNLYERFMCFDQIAPGKSNVGTLHYAPNSQSDYEWGVMTPVQSCADDWYQFPNLPNPPNDRTVDARDWGNGDIREHHKWWLKHLPKAAGVTNGIANNWWRYVIDVNDPIFENH